MRTWIFIANRNLTGFETTKVEEEIKNFLAQWKSHGKPIKANGFCFENAAIVLVADETDVQASGCSIDKINQWVRTIGQNLGIDFFDRFNVLTKDLSANWNLARFTHEVFNESINSTITSWDEFNKKAGK